MIITGTPDIGLLRGLSDDQRLATCRCRQRCNKGKGTSRYGLDVWRRFLRYVIVRFDIFEHLRIAVFTTWFILISISGKEGSASGFNGSTFVDHSVQRVGFRHSV